MGKSCWAGNPWAEELYLKAERSAEAGSVGSGGRRLGVISPQPERITRVQDDLQQSQPGHGHDSILPLHCASAAKWRSNRHPSHLASICHVFKPWHIPMVLGDLQHLWVTGMFQIKVIRGSF